jgi:hypothetical protein
MVVELIFDQIKTVRQIYVRLSGHAGCPATPGWTLSLVCSMRLLKHKREERHDENTLAAERRSLLGKLCWMWILEMLKRLTNTLLS